MYCRNEELEPGWVVFSSGRLLHRPCSFDAKPYQLCLVVDPFTLQVLPSLDPLFHFILLVCKLALKSNRYLTFLCIYFCKVT